MVKEITVWILLCIALIAMHYIGMTIQEIQLTFILVGLHRILVNYLKGDKDND